MNVLAFTICFAAWTMYSVLITFLIDNGLMQLDRAQVGWIIGAPILTGSILRLPVGLLTDRLGGKPVFVAIMLISAVFMYATSFASTFTAFFLWGLAFGLCGATFATGVAYTSIWFPKEKQGTALGLLGVGNIGTAVTALGAPQLLKVFTENGANLEGWRRLPQAYAIALIAVAILFAIVAVPKKPDYAARKTAIQMLAPLKQLRVWRFGLYYFLLFGGFVAISQWLIPYYLTVYAMPLAMAGLMATLFSVPSALTRAVGGFIADRFGARHALYFVLSGVAILFVLLSMPRMDIQSPGEGILADKAGTVTAVTSDTITVGDKVYRLRHRPVQNMQALGSEALILPRFDSWQEPAVQVGETVKRRQLLARGSTHIYFQANQWVFTVFLFGAGILMGLGMAAVFKHIPDYFPSDVGVVGGLVGVLGGLGGFFLPILFGTLLKSTGIWTTCWLFMAALAIVCMVWMHFTVLKMTRAAAHGHD
jgi:NNP family nitrate/nitrite transporter-like MFS transporter